MTLWRRYLLVQALMVWQGGFVFYSAFVVPLGTEVLGSSAVQGAVTARVVEILHLLGFISLGACLWDMLVAVEPERRSRHIRWVCWIIAACAHGLLLYFYLLLVSFMDPGRRYVVIHPPFYPVHRLYLWTCTGQWLVLAVWLLLTLRAWQNIDRQSDHEISKKGIGNGD
ncbi:MAG: hypothetical protein NZU63_02850 [Gemmataceae bacterium]|nr:hypothetical protein [Gemmataceae bacterium]MDW8241806.1 hypothetical protein [Thermogemmata sp.]